MRRVRGLSCFLLFVAMSGACFGQSIYVAAADGNDSDVGLRPESALATIQAAINSADEGDTVIVSPGRYEEDVFFLGKNITLRSTGPSNSNIVRSTTIVGTVNFRGTERADCVLSGFKIDGYIIGYDQRTDPGGENHCHASISHCILENIATHCGGVINGCDGMISNCLIANISYSCRRAWPVAAITNCRGVIENCTMANMRDGIEIRQDETLTIRNCIIDDSAPFSIPEGAVMNVSYCAISRSSDVVFGSGVLNRGAGNIDSDPCFADADGNDYHLKSQGGRWEPNEGRWMIDDVTSPCIDAGDPMDPIGEEAFANGGFINMGAYGGSSEASKSYFGKPPCEVIVAGDINGDCLVDFGDFRIMALHWLDSDNSTSDVSYHVGECSRRSDSTSQSVAESIGFSVEVRGSHVHFEDVIPGNCCLDKMELQMTVVGDLIVILEDEYVIGNGCRCNCSYPTTAELGPFDDGMYRLEVYKRVFYDDQPTSTDFVGSTTVTIGPG